MSNVKDLVIRLDPELYKLLVAYCDEYSLTMHTVITKAINQYCCDKDE